MSRAAGYRYERSPMRPPGPWSARRHVMAAPVTATELDGQLREIVEHAHNCRWRTGPFRRPGEPLTVTEDRACTCTAVYRRNHLRALIRAASTGQLPPAVAAP